MLLATTQNLEELLVQILSEHRTATVSFLRQEVTRRYRNYSLPAIYKELRKLEDQGVVFRRGTKLSLSLAWVLNLTALADRMHSLHVENPEFDSILPIESKRSTLRFSSLERLDDFWVHACILMAQNSKRKKLYQWFPHPWFNLIHSQKSGPFHQALKVGGYSVENIVGGNTWLDHRAAMISARGVYEYNFAPSVFQPEQDTYYSATDTFLLTIKLTEGKTREIEHVYESTRSTFDIDISKLFNIVSNAPGTVVTIARGGRQLKQVWNKFVDYFQVSSDQRL